MPSFAYLATEVLCPRCGALISDRVTFQWGYCPGRMQLPDSTYRLGDAIAWRHCADGSILPWTYFTDSLARSGGNLGDPQFRDILTQHQENFDWEDPARPRVCHVCGELLQGAVVEIRDGVIQGIRVYRPDEFSVLAVYYVIEPSGVATSMPDWNDHPMAIVQTC